MPNKQPDITIWIIIGILAFAVFGQKPAGTVGATGTTGGNTAGGVDLCTIVEPDLAFTGQRMFLSGTSIANESARVIKLNGDSTKRDLGYTSLNGGTESTEAKGEYKIYYGENSTVFYEAIESYTAPCQDASDQKVGVLCQIDTAPTITAYDQDGNPQGGKGSGTNVQVINTGETVDFAVQIKAAADKCFGNPSATKLNAICFDYNATVIKAMTLGDAPVSEKPYAISSNVTFGLAQSCYQFDKIADTEKLTLSGKVESQASQDPDSDHNATIRIDDIGFDLNGDSLDEIWGFEDELLNPTGATGIPSGIYTMS